MLQVWEQYFKELLNLRETSELVLPSSVEGHVKLGEIGDADLERATIVTGILMWSTSGDAGNVVGVR